MRIDSSTIGMESARSYTSQTKESRTSFMAIAAQMSELFVPGEGVQEDENGEQMDRAEAVRHMLNGFSTQRLTGSAMVLSDRGQAGHIRSIRQQCIDFLLEMLFRSKIRRVDDNAFSYRNYLTEQSGENLVIRRAPIAYQATGTQTYYEYSETETTTFSTVGTVRTADGREIDFNLNLVMTREFREVYEETYMQIEQVFLDPLVINLDGNIAELEDQTIVFDLDCDGILDNIHRLSSRSGYLAFDRNEDGVINDGSELFGTVSGNGFADLLTHDLDGNGWIDEADEIFARLLIWIMESDGTSSLFTLAEKGIGAIYLGNVATQFSLTNKVNETQAVIRNTGLFLYENGAVGSMQQIDVAKYEA